MERFLVRSHAQLLKEDAEPVLQHLFPGQLSLLQLLPVPLIDHVVAAKDFFRRLHAELADGLGQGDALRLVEVQDGIVKI